MSSGISAVIIKDRNFIFLLIGGILFLNITSISVLSPILILLFGLMIGVLIISIFAPEDFKFLFGFYLLGFFMRVFLSFLFYIVSFVSKNNYSPGFLFPNDGYAYSLQGWEIFRFTERGIKLTMENYLTNLNVVTASGNITPYDFFASFVYSITGYSPLSLFFISSLAGSIAALFIYLIAKELFSKNVARISCIFAFFWPSFIMWSTQNLKEPMIAMFIFILLWSIFYMSRYPSPVFFLLSIISVLALLEIGLPYLAIVVPVTLFAGLFLFMNYLFKNKFVTLLIVGFLSIASFIILKDKILALIFEKSSYDMGSYKSILEFLSHHRYLRAYGRLQFLKGIDISSLGNALTFAPLGLLYAIFAPFPWQLGSVMQIIAAPETLLFYILLPFTIRGIVFAYKKRFNQSALLLFIIVGILVFLALAEGNIGTLFRHRSIAFYLLFIFTAIGISLRKRILIKV